MSEIRTAAEQLAAEQQRRAEVAEEVEDLVSQLERALEQYGVRVDPDRHEASGEPGIKPLADTAVGIRS